LLDAKHKPVRSAAIDALSRLPHSALCQRAVAYLTDTSKGAAVLSLSIKRGMFGLLKGSTELVLTLPDTQAYDKAVEKTLARDGYDIKVRQSTTDQSAAIGAKLALVTQWLSVAPLDVLCERMGVSNADLFAAAAQHESGDDLIEALAQSLLTQARAPAHVLDALMATKKVSHSMQMALIARLSVEQKQAHLMKEGVIPTVGDFCTVFTAAEGINAPLSLWILNVLRQYKHDGYNRVWNSSDTVAFALRLDVDKASDFLNEARAEQALNQADTPSNQACYDAYFWKPLFQALDISIQTRRAFAGAASI
jgi:hypothetical protein